MSYELYKVLHIFFAVLAVSAVATVAMAGEASRRTMAIVHGVSLVLLLVTGFGLIARLQLGFPGWVWAKIVIWLALGGALVLARRAAGSTRLAVWLFAPILALAAAFLAIYKP